MEDDTAMVRLGHADLSSVFESDDPSVNPFAGISGETFLDPPASDPFAYKRIRNGSELAWFYLGAAEAVANGKGSPIIGAVPPLVEDDFDRMYPTLMLLRQSVELALKEVLRWWVPGGPGNHHDLMRLWQDVERAAPTFFRKDDDWTLTRNQVLLWHRVDPSGMTFRYPDERAVPQRGIYEWLPAVPDLTHAVRITARCVALLLRIARSAG